MNQKLYFGHHILTKYGFTTTADYAHKTGANIFQMFIRSPHSYKASRRAKKDLIKVRNSARKYGIKILVHGNYMMNFCNPEDSFIHKRSTVILKEDLEDALTLEALGVVVHMGHNVKKLKLAQEEAEKNFIKGLETALKNSSDKSTIILETGAGQGDEVFTKLNELGNLRRRIDKKYHHRIKFCIDTCHIFAAGYDVSSPKYVRMLDDTIENFLGWDNVAVIHFNDSKEPLNCHKDRHQDVGKGYIGLDGLTEFGKICYKHNIPMVLETPSDEYDGVRFHYTDQMKLMRKRILED